MNISRFFVDRPVFAGVLSILIVVAGLIGMRALPISEYPEVAPPTVVGALLLVAAAGTTLVLKVEAESDLLKFFSPSHPLTQSTARVEASLFDGLDDAARRRVTHRYTIHHEDGELLAETRRVGAWPSHSAISSSPALPHTISGEVVPR